MKLRSRAGHDAIRMAPHCPTQMIFVPCKDGVSHNELEDATPDTLAYSLTGALKGGLKLPSRAACRRYALDRFQWSLVAERTAQVYRKVLGVRS